MRKYQQMVQQFHEKAGITINHRPTIPNEKDCALRYNLIKEELMELAHGLTSKDTTEVADAIGDLLYVVLGTAVTCGIDIQPVFEEIHASNMTKFIDGYRREDGKWMKGPSYTPANIKPIIDQQIAI